MENGDTMKKRTRQMEMEMEAEQIVLGNRSIAGFSIDSEKVSDQYNPSVYNFLPATRERRSRMDTGTRLKYHRKKRRLELEELAADILSPEELKKIELGETSPSLETLEALCKKLQIPLAPVENPIGQELISQFKQLLLHPQDKMRIREHYSAICNHPLLNIDEEIELEYNIQLVRYFVVTGDLDSAEEKIQETDRFKEFMNQEQYYLFHKYLGNYHYVLGEYEEALKLYMLAEKIIPTSLPETECGDLYFSIGLSGIQVWKNDIADKYTKMALAIYEKNFIPKRIVECHNNIAIAQQRFGNFKSAMEHFKTALTIGSKLNIEFLRYNIEFNYGYFYFLFQNYDSAITHLENSLEYVPNEYILDLLTSYCVLIKCQIEKGNMTEAKKWVYKGKKIIDEKQLSLESPSSKIFKEVYIEFYALMHLTNEEYDKFDKVVTSQLIPIFKADNNFYELGYFCGHLGNVYFKLGKYKKAAVALDQARESYKKLINVN